jgi:hypothetical protein
MTDAKHGNVCMDYHMNAGAHGPAKQHGDQCGRSANQTQVGVSCGTGALCVAAAHASQIHTPRLHTSIHSAFQAQAAF